MPEETDNSSKMLVFCKKLNEGPLSAVLTVFSYAVCCARVLLWAVSGNFWNNQSLGCGLDTEFESRLENEAQLIYVWSGCNLVFCVLLLLAICRRKGSCKLMLAILFLVFVVMSGTLIHLVIKDSQEVETFQKKYLALLPFTDTVKNPESNRSILTEINCWQTQFKCCGLQNFQDWNNSFPDSCFYDEEQDNSWVGTTLLPRRNIYEKACFPTITSLVEKRSSFFWIITIVWITIIAAPFAIVSLGILGGGCVGLYLYIDENPINFKNICSGKKMVPVVFIRKKNNNHTEEEDVEAKGSVRCSSGKSNNNQTKEEDVEAKGSDWEDMVTLEGLEENPVRMIPVSLLKRLQEELDPPPVQHQVQNSSCMCIFPPPKVIRQFYTVLIDDSSPLLPSDAMLVDDRPTRFCYFDEGHRTFDIKDIVWPKDRLNRNTAC